MKFMMKMFFFTLCMQHVVFADCASDLKQMDAQIQRYGSISTGGCPLKSSFWGINSIKLVEGDANRCYAECKYSNHSQMVACAWDVQNWGDTLSCYYPLP